MRHGGEILPNDLERMPWEAQEGEPLSGVGICLSGGGLRSASFCLGVVQTLQSTKGLLFGPAAARYLAVVSGGSYLGAGKDKWRHEVKRAHVGRGGVNKTPVMGMIQRAENGTPGKVIVKVVEGTGVRDLLPQAKQHILPSTTVFTDESYAYRSLGELGYKHERVNHAQGVYVSGNVHTNSIEGFWATVKRGIGGNYHSISTKFLQSYLDEYAFRFNNRETMVPRGVFGAALSRIPLAD
ncbi:MAG: IS1595 family transposase [Actinomycetota bacterium]|nr:IS1595 family transposase [Actinomycetota bacterium]